jgi:hypothetical protein
MTTEASQQSKVTNPERIIRVLQKIASGGLSVQIRALKQPETAVKGRAVESGSLTVSNGVRIGGISEKGRAHLQNFAHDGVQVEFVLMSTKVVFSSRVIEFVGNQLLLSIPDSLTSIERRKDARFPITVSTRAYLQLQDWFTDTKDPTCPPFFEYQRDFATLLHVGDVSVGGLSIVSRFPFVCKALQRGAVVDRCALILPLTSPIIAPIEVRWVKRLRERISDYNGEERTMRMYKFGIQFVNPQPELELELRKFMARLAVAEAI